MTLILSGTNGVSDVDGTAATPAVRGSDTNTGIFFPAADTIAFAEGGVESARFDASGNLLVGTTSAGNYKFNVEGPSLAVSNFSSYTADGVFNANARFSAIRTPSSATLRFGYQDDSGGQYNPAIGFRAPSVLGTGQTNYSNIIWSTTNGALAFGTGTGGSYSERARIDSSGRLLIAGTNASYASGFLQLNAGKAIIASTDSGFGQIQIGGPAEASIGFISGVSVFGDNPASSSGDTHVWAIGANVFGVGGGSWGIGNKGANNFVARINWNSTSWIFSSDERLKDVEGRVENALDKVAVLRPVYFTWKNDEAKQRKVGLLAQDVLQVLPEAVSVPEEETREDGSQNYLGLGMSDLVPLLTAAIQEQQAMIASQSEIISAQQAALEQLKADVAVLKGQA